MTDTTTKRTFRSRGIAYGGDYNPEQWPDSVWDEDVRLMRLARVNLVTVGVFAWSRLQPQPQAWDFDWLDRVLDLLHANDIAVDLATATASPPPWFSLQHPESLPVDERGVRLSIGSRQHFCPSSPDFASAAGELVGRLAERYGSHPALVMWHVGNEYGDHIEQCYCDTSADHFRGWLEARYGTIDALNEAWNTGVWSGRFSDWAEVMPPRAAPGPIRPSLQLDYRRFSSDALLACFEQEREILVRATPDIPLTTNFMRPSKAIDQWKWAAREDVVSCDIYPDPQDPLADMDAAFTHDLMRSLGGGRPWLIMEQAPSAVDWRPLNVPQDPAVVRRRSLQAIGAGADGIMFFQWRGSRSGPEMLHSAMLPAGGRDAPHWSQTERLGADLARLAEVTGSRCAPAGVALLIDWESWWALEQDGHPTDALRFRDLALRMYAPFREANVLLDMRRPEDDLTAYRVIAVPNLFLMSTAAVANLTKFVRDGGIALVGPFSGIVDPNYELPGGSHPALLRDLLGITVAEWWPLAEGYVDISFDDGPTHRGSIWRDAIELSGAVSVARFNGTDALGRRPAITRNHLGDGQAWYLGTIPDHAAMVTVVGEVLSQGRVDPLGSTPAGVELLKREADSVSFLFVVNRGDRDVAVPLHAVEGVDLLTSSTVSRLLHLGPQGVAIVKSHH